MEPTIGQHDDGRNETEKAGLIVGADGLARPRWADSDELLREYYDTEWGMPVTDEQGIYERICLESFQAGLSWLTILRRRESFREAFAGFDPDVVASFNDDDVARLLADSRIIRNRRKIMAAIINARATVALREGAGLEKACEGSDERPTGAAAGSNEQPTGLAELVWSFKPEENLRPLSEAEVPSQTPESVALAKALRGAGFTMVGPVTMFALMGAIGIVDAHVVGSHRRGTSGIWPE
ncbi:MAG: DNA-3-methyladenine glycosylase I [Ancrocorticia sp.]